MFMTIIEMDHNAHGTKFKKRIREICIPYWNNAHYSKTKKRYFSNIKPTRIIVKTISGPADMIEGTGGKLYVAEWNKIFHK